MGIKTISDSQKKYFQKIDSLDLELLIAHTLEKPREFVLAHPEYKLTQNQELRIKNYADRRIKNEPLAYILGHKEFFGLDFKVNKHTLIPRPETELLIEEALKKIQDTKYKIQNTIIIDVGTGSGCIIISIVKNLNFRFHDNDNAGFLATDISSKALKIAKRNATTHNVDKKIKFLKGDLLNPIIKNSKLEIRNSSILIVANLPYLSKKIYSKTSNDIKNFEPKSALYSSHEGLAHYKKLFKQIGTLKKCSVPDILCLIEISPEQKPLLKKTIDQYFPNAKIKFKKDLCGFWRICEIKI